MSVPPTFTKQHLSGATRGQPIAVAAVATPGTLIHTDSNTADHFDEVWLWASNVDTVDRVLTLELGGTGLGNEADYAIPAGTTVQVLLGQPMSGGDVIRAYADAANDVNVFGYVNRMDQTP